MNCASMLKRYKLEVSKKVSLAPQLQGTVLLQSYNLVHTSPTTTNSKENEYSRHQKKLTENNSYAILGDLQTWNNG